MTRRITIVATLLTLLTAIATHSQAAEDLLVADFEGPDYGQWTATGTAFGSGPAQGTIERQNPVSGYLGHGLVNTYLSGDGSTGTLTSPPLVIQRKYLNFLIGGGAYPDSTCIRLLIDGKVVRSATGPNKTSGGTEQLKPAGWDVDSLRGKTAQIEIVDQANGGWGHVNVDQIVQSDTPSVNPVAYLPPAEERDEWARRFAAFDFEDIVFAARRVDTDGHWYANFGTWSNNPDRTLYHEGGRLCVFNVASGNVTTLLDDPQGGVRDPQLHYDGQKILFCYRRGGQPYYHLYEINVDGSDLTQITDGPYDDLEPTYLPDGDIVFCSSRCNRMVQCYFVRVAVLHRCEADGSDIRPLSANIEQDNTPWVLPDGRILYMRWEYVDRSQVGYHHLWTMNPDGTNQMIYYGNQTPSTVMLDAKPVPGTDRVVASFSPGHGRLEHAGVITLVDPDAGPDARASAQAIRNDAFFRDPYPLSGDCFLVAGEKGGLGVLDGDGRFVELFDLSEVDKQAGLVIHEPRPLRSRKRERVLPELTSREEATGRVILGNVYQGRNMADVQPGEIKKLLVLEALPKPVNFSGGWEPLSFGGTFTLERILGTVPVEPDGSAYLELPPLRSLFFVALDENDMAVKRMQSFLSVQPGEVFSCVGCHEQRTQTILSPGDLLAMRRPASRIEPIADVPDVIDFPRDVQPIVDRHCVACHDYDATEQGGPRAGGVILSGDRGPFYSHSYVAFTVRQMFVDGRNLLKSNYPPRVIGSSASRLLLDFVDGQHHDAKLSDREKRVLRLWIDTAAAYPGTYAALGCGMVGGQGWNDTTTAVLAQRCGSCHADATKLPGSPGDSLGMGTTGTINPADPRLQFSPHVVFNLTRPQKSLMLLAPLASDAGGLELCGRAVFESVDDPDYQTLLTAVEASRRQLDTIKRFDMPGFRPNVHYVREMQFYGVLADDLGENTPIDVYQTDQAYWRSLWRQPTGE